MSAGLDGTERLEGVGKLIDANIIRSKLQWFRNMFNYWNILQGNIDDEKVHILLQRACNWNVWSRMRLTPANQLCFVKLERFLR